MSSASPGANDRKPTRRPGRKAPTLRPESNTSGTAEGWVVKSLTDIASKWAFLDAICSLQGIARSSTRNVVLLATV